MTAEHLKLPRIQDRIWLLTMAKLQIEEAARNLEKAYPYDPQLGSGYNKIVWETHVRPLLREASDTSEQIKLLEHIRDNPGDGVRRWTREPEPKEEQE